MAAFEISLGILRLGTYFKLYAELTAHWREILPGIVCEFAYENVIADQKRETADLLRFCVLEWKDAGYRVLQYIPYR